MKISPIEKNDASQLVEMFIKLDSETQFMMLEPGERNLDLDHQMSECAHYVDNPRKAMFVAKDEDQIVGYVSGHGKRSLRNSHCLYIVLGVIQSYWRQNIATQLMQELEQWAKDNEFHRLELTVQEDNNEARRLYQKLGFAAEGTKYRSILIDGHYKNEVNMQKWV